jgi:type VI secretion system protein ImpF
MAEDVPRERLQPSLLDRLTDQAKSIAAEIGQVRQSLLPRLGEGERAALAALIDPESAAPVEGALPAPLARLDAETAALAKRLVGLERRRRLELETHFVVSPERLRAYVLRDLTWLFNTESLAWREVPADDPRIAAMPDIDAWPLAAASVVNYGIPPLAGRTGLDPAAVAGEIERAIRRFEPRLRAGTVKVTPVTPDEGGRHAALAFDIEAELWSEPQPLRLWLRTLIDLESGTASLRAREAG